MPAELLAAVRRGGWDESLHYGHVAVVDGRGRLITSVGDPDQPIFLRSAAKPFQALALVMSGALQRFSLDERDLAIACASHTAEAVHVAQVQHILRAADLDASLLQCGAHPPGDREAAEELRRSGQSPTSLHSNCSGKHSGMLAVAKHLGADLGTYLSPDAPGQRLILRLIAEVMDLREGEIGIAVDGCSAPVFRVPLRALALGFARLAQPESAPKELQGALTQVRDAILRHPYLVAGRRRIGPDLMAAGAPRIVAKTGAEAVFGVGDSVQGQGLAIKVMDGAERAMGPALVESLRQARFLSAEEVQGLRSWHHPELCNFAGIAVGDIEPRVRLPIAFESS